MNEEFDKFMKSQCKNCAYEAIDDAEWCDENCKPGYLKAFLAGSAAMRERCAEVAEGPFKKESQPLDYYVSGRLDAAAAIRGLEI